jgi:GDPmannose 4,6-dehydratase
MDNSKVVENPTERSREKLFGIEFEMTKVDKLMLTEELEFTIEDRGVKVYTNKGEIPIRFDPTRFRPAEVPILLAETKKIQELGFRIEHELEYIIREQLDYFSKKELRK